MKLTILGATGSVGRELLPQALAAGHTVTVVTRNPASLGELRTRVTVVEGNVTDAAVVDRAIAGAEAVVSLLGHTKSSPDDLFAATIAHTIKTMYSHNVRRLVVLTNTAVTYTEDQPTFAQRAVNGFMDLAFGSLDKDHVAQARLIQNSTLAWTIVRAPKFGDGSHTGKYRVSNLDKSAGWGITRADLADFLLACATSDKYVQSMPMVSQ